MSHQCHTCQDKLLKLNQQVSVMRKEIKNLRQSLDSARRAHSKHIGSLQSAVSKLNLKTPSDAQTAANIPAASLDGLEQGVLQTVPIGYLSSCFSEKNGTPRQPTICSPSRAELRIQHGVFNNPEHALIGLEQYSHVWIIFVFHKNGHLSAKAKVKPPRLNGQKVGVYSTRSPHRPNALGLTLAKLDKVEGDTIYLSNIDMIDGTPVLDIKPYIPDYDSIHSRINSEKTGVQNEEFARTELTDADFQNPENETEYREDTKQQILECDDLIGRVVNSDQLTNLQSALKDVQVFVSHNNNNNLEGETTTFPSSPKSLNESSIEKPCYDEGAYSTIASWIREPPVSSLEVRFTAHAEKQLDAFIPAGCTERNGIKFKFLRNTEEARTAIRGVLAADPRSVYRRGRCTDKLFYFTLDTADVTCWFGEDFAEVLQIRPVQQLRGVEKD